MTNESAVEIIIRCEKQEKNASKQRKVNENEERAAKQ